MNNRLIVIVISIIAILMLPACASSSTQPKVATPTVQPTLTVQPTPTLDLVFGQSPTDLAQDQPSSQQLFVSISSVTN